MRLATQHDGTADGVLIVVSADGARFLSAQGIAPTLQAALEDWVRAEPALRALAVRLDAGHGDALDATGLAAPLPRAWQWLDGSAFESHGRLMARLFGVEPKSSGKPLMYQGMSHRFLGPCEDAPFMHERGDIDFEGEFGIVTDAVPMGISAGQAAEHIRLVVLINDWSLRALAGAEMRTGFGWIQAKPACALAPFAVTPDTLGPDWRNGRVQMRLRVDVNGQWFGEPHGGAMAFSFPELVAHAAATRALCPGTIIGSGTVSNDDYRTTGSTCIAERRAIETLESGGAVTAFLRFGDCVRMAATAEGRPSPFGEINQRVVQYRPADQPGGIAAGVIESKATDNK